MTPTDNIQRPQQATNLSYNELLNSVNMISPTTVSRVDSDSAGDSHENKIDAEPFPILPTESIQASHEQQYDRSNRHYAITVSQPSIEQPAIRTETPPSRSPIGVKRLSTNKTRDNLAIKRSWHSKADTARPRSTSAPQGLNMTADTYDGDPLQHSYTVSSYLPTVPEAHRLSFDGLSPNNTSYDLDSSFDKNSSQLGVDVSRRQVSGAAGSTIPRPENRVEALNQPAAEYDDRIVDILDVLDPEVSALTTLTNVQNSLFVPDLGAWINRRPTFELTRVPSTRPRRLASDQHSLKPLSSTSLPVPSTLNNDYLGNLQTTNEDEKQSHYEHDLKLKPTPSIASILQEGHYAVLPHGVSLDGWSNIDKALLDDHVRHMLHSRREGFKRSRRAFGKYVRKPLGLFVTVYAILITIFGLAWVLFLIGWIYVGEKQLYVINVIDNVLVALFAIVGDGMAPFRVLDTYHMLFIAYYHRLIKKVRRQQGLPKLYNRTMSVVPNECEVDLEAVSMDDKTEKSETSLLTPIQQKKLEHHQQKFSSSHSFYKPSETITHKPFPHHLFIAIVLLLDMHSCLQIALGATTWGIDYRVRPKALTPTILSFSITVNITAGILIKVGDSKTRKKDVLKRMFRQDLTGEAMGQVLENKKRQNQNAAKT